MSETPKPQIIIPDEPSSGAKGPSRPEPTALQGLQSQDGASQSTLKPSTTAQGPSRKKRKDHRGGKKKRNRRQSFAAPSDDGSGMPETSQTRGDSHDRDELRTSFYRLKPPRRMSNESIESEALLDHRCVLLFK